MKKLLIETTGELKLDGELVGKIAWSRAFVEGDVAVEYVDAAMFDAVSHSEVEEMLDGVRRLARSYARHLRRLRENVGKLTNVELSAALEAISARMERL